MITFFKVFSRIGTRSSESELSSLVISKNLWDQHFITLQQVVNDNLLAKSMLKQQHVSLKVEFFF